MPQIPKYPKYQNIRKNKAIIFHARKSLFFNDQQVWVKNEGGLFDVTVGAFDGIEVCETVGNFLSYQLLENCKKKNWFIEGRWISNV